MSVINNAFETKGTNLYFFDNITETDGTVRKLTCPTAIPGVGGGTKDKIDTTCLDQLGDFRTFIGGFADASELSVPFIVYKGDLSHQALFPLKAAGSIVGWYMGLSDSASAPTADTDLALVSPTDRTGFSFAGYVSDVTIDAAINDVIKGTVKIQPTGFTTPHWAA